MPMIPTAEERLRGFRASAKMIDQLLDVEQKGRRERIALHKDRKRTLGYKLGHADGYFEGLTCAHSLLAFGDHPLVPQNAHTIMNILRDEDAAACHKAQALPEPEEYVPSDIIAGDRTLATHCETFLCTECEMSREDRMKRITQSIADYREHHAARARKGQRPE